MSSCFLNLDLGSLAFILMFELHMPSVVGVCSRMNKTGTRVSTSRQSRLNSSFIICRVIPNITQGGTHERTLTFLKVGICLVIACIAVSGLLDERGHLESSRQDLYGFAMLSLRGSIFSCKLKCPSLRLLAGLHTNVEYLRFSYAQKARAD